MTNSLVTAMAKKHVSLSSLPELACTGDKCFKNISKMVFTAMAKKHVSSSSCQSWPVQEISVLKIFLKWYLQ